MFSRSFSLVRSTDRYPATTKIVSISIILRSLFHNLVSDGNSAPGRLAHEDRRPTRPDDPQLPLIELEDFRSIECFLPGIFFRMVRLFGGYILPIIFEFFDAYITEAEVGRRVMPLEADMASSAACAFAGVVMSWTVVGPIDRLIAINPGREMIAIRIECHGKPDLIIADDCAGGHTAIDGAGPIIDGLTAIPFLKAVLNLHFVAILIFLRHAAEEQSRIQPFAVGNTFELEEEVTERCRGLQVSWSIFNIQVPLFRDCPLRFIFLRIRENLPSRKVLTIE